MARKGTFKPRVKTGDPIYGNLLLAKLINRSMRDGKKSVASREIYEAMNIIKEKTGEDPMKTFNLAMENIKPTMEVKAKRVGGAAYQVPMLVRGERQNSLAVRWLVAAANSKSNTEFHTYALKLADELMNAAKGEGASMKKRQEVERVAEANKAFSHFRW